MEGEGGAGAQPERARFQVEGSRLCLRVDVRANVKRVVGGRGRVRLKEIPMSIAQSAGVRAGGSAPGRPCLNFP